MLLLNEPISFSVSLTISFFSLSFKFNLLAKIDSSMELLIILLKLLISDKLFLSVKFPFSAEKFLFKDKFILDGLLIELIS